MNLKQIWSKKGMGGGVSEKCLVNPDGDYIGVRTGTKYPGELYRESEQFRAIIKGADEENSTGMYHLSAEWFDKPEENRKTFKEAFIGCEVTVERAHNFGEFAVYRCVELQEYFSSNEIELLPETK